MQRTFGGGEIAPSLYGGADQPRYQSALATCRNFMVMRHGGVTNRPGSQFIAEVKDSTVRTYLLKFNFNDDDTYSIEAGALYFRFFRQGARVLTGTVTAWSGASTYVVGDLASRLGVNYYCILGHGPSQQPPNATSWYALTSDIMEIPTPYAAADLARLKYVESGDIVTITHPSYQSRELRRTSSRWTLSLVTTAPSISAPGAPTVTAGTGGTITYSYKITAVKADTFEESVGSAAGSATSEPPNDEDPNVIGWAAVTGATEYNVYLNKDGNGVWGFVGVAASTTFNDIGYEPDFSVSPPIARTLFETSNNFPASAAYFQQRLLFGMTNTDPETIWTSRSGSFKNFTISSPVQDDDAITFRMAGRRVSEVRHLIEVGRLVVLTSTGEWIVFGDVDGVLRPTAINLRQQTYYGASHTIPVIVGNAVLFAQARGGLLRDLRFEEATDGYDGRDLTLFSPHLFEALSIDRMDFAQTPNSIVWCVMSNGQLRGLTYLRESNVWGWHRHDTDGTYEDLITVPETTTPVPGSAQRGKEEDAIYVIVNRTIGGVTKRYVERFNSRRIEDYRLDGIFLDSALTYNGINSGATTVTLTTAAGWTTADEITVTASVAGTFTAADVGNGITVWENTVAGSVVRITITTFTSGTVVKGTPNATVPTAVRNVAKTTWSRAVDEVTGLAHLEGKTVNVCANGIAILNKVVTSGVISFSALYDVIHVGLPIVADFETLDLDSSQEDIRDRRKLLKSASILVDDSRGAPSGGPDASNLVTYVPEPGDSLANDIFDTQGALTRSQWLEFNIAAQWEKPGRLFIRQTDPLPLQILAVMPHGEVGG